MPKRALLALRAVPHWLVVGGWIAVFIAVLWMLLPSQYRIGLRYTFDVDELFQINAVYQMRLGAFPYRDFLFPYTPIMQWMLLPFTQTTSMMETLEIARVMALFLYAVRSILTGIISITLLGVPFGLLAIIGLLIDPFTVFSGLQFRPDTIAALLEVCAMITFLWYRQKKTVPLALVFGFFLSAMVLSSLKCTPAAVGLLISAIFLTKNRSIRSLLPLVVGALVPALPFVVVMLHNGAFLQMIQAVIFDAKAINDSLLYPLQILNFYWPVNWYLFGYEFRSPLWYFAFLLPLFALCGLTLSFFGSVDSRERHAILPIAITALLQTGSLLGIRSVFIQYHLVSNWLLIILAVWFLKYLYRRIVSLSEFLAIPIIIVTCIAIYALVTTQVTVNKEREKQLSYDAEIVDFKKHHSYIPEHAAVYPGLFWRANGAYIGYGWNIGDLPKRVLLQHGGLDVLMSKKNIDVLYLPGEQRNLLPQAVSRYIDRTFVRHSEDTDLWIRRNDEE